MTSSTTPAGSESGSPRTKVKFLCSQGGKILLRPGDGVLKYVGGETRVVSVPRGIDFSGLKKKIAVLNEGNVILKYQLINDDLDALVTVRSNEDLRHMMDEYDRHELTGAPRLRAFLFPIHPAVTETPVNLINPNSLEQHYIDAINGVFRIGTKYSYLGHNSYSVPISTTGSSSSTPNSVDGDNAVQNVAPIAAIRLQNYITSRLNMHRVQSSPNIVNYHHQSGYQSPQNIGSGYQSPVMVQYDRQLTMPPQNIGSGYKSPVMVQYDKQLTMPAPKLGGGGGRAVEIRKAGYPPTIRHVRSVSVSDYLLNEDYGVERRLEAEDWISRMMIPQPPSSSRTPF